VFPLLRDGGGMSRVPAVCQVLARAGAHVDGVQLEPKLRGAYLHVLAGLASFADPDGTNARPSLRSLALRSGVSDRTVTRILAELEDDGEIVTYCRRRRGATPTWTIVMCQPCSDTVAEPGVARTDIVSELDPSTDAVSEPAEAVVTVGNALSQSSDMVSSVRTPRPSSSDTTSDNHPETTQEDHSGKKTSLSKGFPSGQADGEQAAVVEEYVEVDFDELRARIGPKRVAV
jgi:hypothetical protein